MTKIKVEELGCFNEVASVIGVAKANRELFRVANKGLINAQANHLCMAFKWDASPQGFSFWNSIATGANP